MGYTFAYDLGQAASGNGALQRIRMEHAVEQHLRYNHYPPIPTSMAPVAIKAIEAFVDEDYERIIETPFEHRTYGNQVPANAIVEALHLQGFIQGFLDLENVT